MGDTLSGLLVMSDGTVVRGRGGGAPGLAVGELVFQTGMVGYQEALTDPSYAGQILIFTYPLVGNYGVGEIGNQSRRIHPRAVVTHELMSSSGHRSSDNGLDDMLRVQGVPALYAVDTRMLTRKVRMHGVIPAAMSVAPEEKLPSVAELQALAASLNYDSVDFVVECTTPRAMWHPPSNPDGRRVVLVDYGAKQAILDYLLEGGAGVWQVPATTTAEEILSLQPDGVLLSNGPGDPSRLDYAVNTVRGLLDQGSVPVFGICLGHQLLALAAGGQTSKMRFGHRGINQPVLEVATGRVSITTQNHGYMVEPGSIPAEYVVTHTNLNDGSIEGIAHVSRPVWGVQWHPEAHPGPADTRRLFDRFLQSREVANA
ncbi:MAG: carbamoyl-phosphate synthase small subunit [Chloroflexia bacterium]|jgi:carbamoyl-phosphate synthase small subunit|nr:carbamoyl-phosphate synthase small subunit [Chloroflexia bacterium]